MGQFNRRVFFRLPVELPVRFRTSAADRDAPWWEGVVEDLSAGGMRMRSNRLDDVDESRFFENGVGLEIEFAGADDTKLAGMHLPGKVVWLERGDDGARRAGIRFERVGAGQQELLEQFVVDSCRAG